MVIVDIEKLMQDKYNECLEWLDGKDKAQERFNQAWLEYESAKKALEEYDDTEYVARLVAYKDYLAAKLGIVEETEQGQEEQSVEEVITGEIVGEIDTTELA